MKRFLFLSIGFEKPTPEIMGAWEAWFKSIADRIVDQGGLWGGGHEITSAGVSELPFGPNSTTGYIIFTAENNDEALKLAKECPIVASNRIYEIKTK